MTTSGSAADTRSAAGGARATMIIASLVALTLVSTACGSTATSTAGGGLSAPVDGSGLDGSIAHGVEERTVAASGVPTTASARAPGTGESSTAGRALVAAGTTQVKIGLYYADDANDSLAAVGAQSTVPDFKAATEVLVKDINARGGLAGRKLVAVHHAVKMSGDQNTQDQGACSDFTRDRPVTAVVSPGFTSDVLAACLAKAGIPYIFSSGQAVDDAATFKRHPLQSEPISVNLDRLAKVEVDGLVAQNYLRHAKGSQAEQLGYPVKLGVIALDLPTFRDVYERVLAPAYEAKGTPVSEVRFVRSDTAGLSADIDSAVLAFAQRRVTHVTFLTAFGLPPGLFVVRAHSQRYEPRYGFSSQDAMQIVWEDNIRKILGDSSKSQFRGAVGVGWLPLGDVANATAAENAPPSYEHCIQVMRKGGLPPRDTNYNLFLANACDGLWFTDAAFEAGGTSVVSPSTFLAGENKLGTSYAPATVSGTRVGPERHDGVGAVRHFAFFDDCPCFRYTSKRINI